MLVFKQSNTIYTYTSYTSYTTQFIYTLQNDQAAEQTWPWCIQAMLVGESKDIDQVIIHFNTRVCINL